MIYLIIFYWIFSTLFVGLSFLSEKDSPEVGVIVAFISMLFGWLILPIIVVFYICEILKKKFYEKYSK